MINPMLEGEFKEMANTQQSRQDELLQKDNVLGVALGNKRVQGEDTGEPALLVLVRQKVHTDLLREEDVVPESVDGVRTDVVEVSDIMAWQEVMPPTAYTTTNGSNGVGAALREAPARRRTEYAPEVEEYVPQVLRQRTRPVMGGFSVGHPGVTAGTIATCCYDMTPFPGIPSRYYILSNNHVLANSNAARINDPILQPGVFDGGSLPADIIGRLSRFVTIQFRTPTTAPLNLVDAAIAEVPFHLANREIYWIGYVRGINGSPRIGDILQKTGRTTNFTTGRVIAVNATVDVNYGGGRIARFARQIVTTAMSAGGDSGSLVLDRDERAVGLLFAGSPTVTIVNNIVFVQNLLKIRITET